MHRTVAHTQTTQHNGGRHVITVLQVADNVGDTDPAPWVAMAARRVSAVRWRNGGEADADVDAMLGHLLALPPHLLHLVLSAAINTPGVSQQTLFTTLPRILHDALIACMCDVKDGALTAPCNAVAMFFHLLSKAVIPGPGPVRFNLPVRMTVSAAAAAVLSQALAAHTTLASVDLQGPCMSPPALCAFSARLPARPLPALTHLRLDHDHGRVGSTSRLIPPAAPRRWRMACLNCRPSAC